MAGGGADGAIGPASRGVRDLETLRSRILRELTRALVQLDTVKGTDRLERDQAAMANAVRVLRQVDAALEAEGVGAVRTVLQQRAVEAATAVADGSPIPADARSEIRAIVDERNADVVAVFAEAQDAIRQAVNAGTTTNGSLGDLVDEVARTLDTATQKAAAAVDAAIMAAGRRTVVAAAQESGLDLVYLYVGPDDAKTRPFCAALVGKAVTEAKLATLDNGMDLPAADYCGGYGCRHSWAPMPLQDALDEHITILR
jgi:hypothetical protein